MTDTTQRKRPLPVSESLFDSMIERGYYYVDKTLLIKEMLDKEAKVVLCTRPRRFGKTLNQTMLKCFFEDTAPLGGRDTRSLFRGLKIEEAGERYMEEQGKYPVIYLSFKDAKRETFEASYRMLKEDIVGEFRRHRYVSEKISDEEDRVLFDKLASGGDPGIDYSRSLRFLSECLENFYGKKVVLLIDEYDVPLENSWSRSPRFYDKMIDFVRPLMSSVLKDNPHLRLAVLTGCLRVSKESIFTGLNNLEVVSILSNSYCEHFGFTQVEADAMLAYYGLESKTDVLRDWYNGYLFGNTEVYNPFSTVRVVDAWTMNIDRFPEPHWVNSSGNDIIRDMLDEMGVEARSNLETLMAGVGKTISAVVHEDITYGDIYNDADNLWNFLFFTGYLKKVGVGRQNEDGELTLDLSIPNIELRYIYKTKIQEWFKEKIRQKDFNPLYEALLGGDAETVREELGGILMETISYMDAKEDFYHGITLGILAGMRDFSAKSNRETGNGRSDIVLRHRSGRGKAVILELKCTPNMREIEKKCEEAVKQIENGKYAEELESECYNDIIKYGIAFCKKSCEVRKG